VPAHQEMVHIGFEHFLDHLGVETCKIAMDGHGALVARWSHFVARKETRHILRLRKKVMVYVSLGFVGNDVSTRQECWECVMKMAPIPI
jgi:hypothetical protein